MTTLAMHQPNFLPWAGFFYKMRQSDIFVIMDTAQVPTRGSYANRAKIKTPTGPAWLTVPLKRGGKPSYAEQGLAVDDSWVNSTMKTLNANYARSPWFETYGDALAFHLCYQSSLGYLNRMLIKWLQIELGLHHSCCIVISGQEDLPKAPKEKLPIMLCQEFGADTYLSGEGARAYNNPGMFSDAGIQLTYRLKCNYTYPQLWGEFEGGLSVIDMLFNCGPNAGRMLEVSP